MNRLFEKLLYIVNMLIAFPIAVCKRKSMRKEKIWLIGIQYDRYENNCKVLYEYLMGKGENVYWVLNKKNRNEMRKFVPEDRMLFRGTIKNYVYAKNAMIAAYSASDFDVAPGLYKIFRTKTCLVNINHGYDAIKNLDASYYRKLPADIILCASEDEARIKVQSFSGKKEQMKVTGYARCDQYIIRDCNEIRKIMIMPTWRPWYIAEKIDFKRTQLFLYYRILLEKLIKTIDDDVVIYFVLHPRLADFYDQEEIYHDKHINYVFDKHRITDLLIESDVLVTDYSSISFDYMYMKKPFLLYWFDYKEYKENVGLYKDIDMFEDVCTTAKQVVEAYKMLLRGKGRYSEIERKKYWQYTDSNNCARIYNTILVHPKCKKWMLDPH